MPSPSRPAKAPTPPARGRLKSMRSSASTRVFVIDQLSPIRDVTARAMFGGVGIYAGDVFFGILAADVLYLKVDDSNRAEYQEAGMSAFKPYANGSMTMPYYQVPVKVLEHSGSLVAWAKRSIAVSRAARKLKKKPRAQQSKL